MKLDHELDYRIQALWDTNTFSGYLELLLNEPEHVYPQSLSYYTHNEEKSELQSWISHHANSRMKEKLNSLKG